MANMPSGSKRSHPDHDHAPRPRDWRDVHLRSPREDRSPRQRERERERDRDRRDGRARSREHERRRGGGRGRDRDRERERDRKDERHRREPARKADVPQANTRGQIEVDGEREEGEISPRNSPVPAPSTSSVATPPKAPSQSSTQIAHVPPPAPDPEPLPELELETASPPPVEDTLAARRARRAAILAKYSGAPSTTASADASAAASPAPPLSVTLSDASQPPSSGITTSVERSTQDPAPVTPIRAVSIAGGLRESVSASPAPEMFELAKENEAGYVQAVAHQENATQGTLEQSAAEYDPSLDRREDERKRVRGEDKKDVEVIMDGDEEEEVEEEEDDVDDMFALATDEPKKKRAVKRKVGKSAAPALVTTTLDTAADAEGYYQIILGEQLDGGRYQVFSMLGKGMFANVVRARVLRDDEGRDGREVAIKITRSQETMIKAGQKEVQILNRLRQADPEDKKHIVRLERTFEHRGHLCLVFESLSMNLRDVVKRFGHDVGLNIRAVRAYAHQLILALSLLRKTNTIHADIKPDNILVNEAKTLVKLCDLGSAADAEGNEITPYLVSRFYRAPEIILGVPYDGAIDVWSLGCTLYELYTGKILFPGRSNNQMLLHMMELKGRFNAKIIKRAQFGEVYFDPVTGAFNSVETNRVTGAETIRPVHISNPTRDLRARIMPSAGTKLKDDEVKLLTSFIDLLDKCLALDPAKRISPKEALVHPFIRG